METNRLKILLDQLIKDKRDFDLGTRKANIDYNPLIEELQNIPELAIFDNKMIHILGFGIRVDFYSLADWLIIRATGLGSDNAIANLSHYITESELECQKITPLGGIEVEKPLLLANELELVPISQDILEHSFYRNFMKGVFHRPTAALIQRFKHPKVHLNPEQKWEEQHQYMNRYQTIEENFEDAILCLTLFTLNGPISFGSYVIAEEWVPCLGEIGGFFPLFVELKGSRKLNFDDYKRIQEIYQHFLNLRPEEQIRLRIPLQRLNSATRRYSIVDSAIDLGIAMEAIFLSQSGEDQGELRFRLCIRASKLLGKDEIERHNLFDIFSVLYDKLRSRAVHSGKVPRRINGKSPNDLLEEGFSHIAKAIELIIRNGRDMDWKSIVLN